MSWLANWITGKFLRWRLEITRQVCEGPDATPKDFEQFKAAYCDYIDWQDQQKG